MLWKLCAYSVICSNGMEVYIACRVFSKFYICRVYCFEQQRRSLYEIAILIGYENVLYVVKIFFAIYYGEDNIFLPVVLLSS